MWLWSLDIDVADISLVSAWGYVYTYIERKRVTIDDLGRYLFIRKGGLNENGLWEM